MNTIGTKNVFVKTISTVLMGVLIASFFLVSVSSEHGLAKKSRVSHSHDVVILDQKLFTIHKNLGPYSPKSRAKHVQTRIIKVIEQPDFDPALFKVKIAGDNVNVMAGDTVITTITKADAAAAEVDQMELGHQYLARIRAFIEANKAKRNFAELVEQVRWQNFSSNLLHMASTPMSLKVGTALLGFLIVMLIAYSIRKSFVQYFPDNSQKYTFSKVVEFAAYFICLIFITVVFRDVLGNLAVILGAISAGVAFALKEVFISLAGWVAVAFGDLYKVGNRVQLGGIKGDVIDITFMRTTLMELGEWVNGDLYTGRIVRISNSVVFTQPLFNYSKDLPFLWDEIVITVKSESDYQLVRKILVDAADQIVGEYVEHAKLHWESVKNKYLVEDEKIDPMVSVTMNAATMDYTVRYPVDFKNRRTTKDKLYESIMDRFNQEKEKIAV